jgi:hypothetical protein
MVPIKQHGMDLAGDVGVWLMPICYARGMDTLADRALRKLRELHFNRTVRAVLAAPPVRAADDEVVIFSMIGTRVLLPSLVAAKSLHARLGRGRFAILDDGTLTQADKAVLDVHLDRPEIRHIAKVDTGQCPRGGTWERLLTLLDLRRDAYVIQLDSDTVTIGEVPEVAAAVRTGTSFTLRGESDAEIGPLAQAAAQARASQPHRHVQASIERVLDQVTIPKGKALRYVRGCSGFAGFARSDDGRALAELFSVEAQRLLGAECWAEWGSEQVTSNFVVANEACVTLLPYAGYFNFWNAGVPDDARFIHFIGTFRYHGGAYAAAARQAIAELGCASI